MQSEFLTRYLNQDMFITSDPQFGSTGLYQHVPQRKRFSSLAKLNKQLVENWNSVISKNDCILCLGDFTQNQVDSKKSIALVEKFTSQLNGIKFLIRGNHDVEKTSWYYDFGWNWVIEFPVIMLGETIEWRFAPSQFCGCIIKTIAEKRILFSHFAIFEDEARDRRYLLEKAYLRDLYKEFDCDYNVHGHTHTRRIDDERCLCACVEQTDLTPIQLNMFLEREIKLQEQQAA